MFFQLRAHNPGLHPHRRSPGLDDTPQKTTAVDHDAAAKGIARQARARATCMHRNPLLCSPTHGGRYILGRAWPHDGQRPHLKQACISSIERATGIVAQHLARDDAPKVFFNSLALGVHASLVGNGGECLATSYLPRPRSLLPIFFMRFQIEFATLCAEAIATIPRTAPIATQAIGHEQIDHHINCCGGKENRKSHDQFVPSPCHAAREQPNHHNGHPELLREIFSYKELRARAHQTAIEP